MAQVFLGIWRRPPVFDATLSWLVSGHPCSSLLGSDIHLQKLQILKGQILNVLDSCAQKEVPESGFSLEIGGERDKR
jgi:hypothetical protein